MPEGVVSVVVARGDKCWLGFRAMSMIWLRKGNITNAMCWGINPLSLEHEGRSSVFYCARSFGIMGGTGRTVFDSLAIGRHGIHTRCNGEKNLDRGRVKCTGTPMLPFEPRLELDSRVVGEGLG